MGAFVGAVEAGAHAIETDIHLSRDGVVVLSHVRLNFIGLPAVAARQWVLILCRMPLSRDVLGRKIRL